MGSIFGRAALGSDAPPEEPPCPVEVTLDELYNGCVKTVRYKRKKVNGVVSEEESKEVIVKRGYGRDSIIVFKEGGNESVKFRSSDLIVKIAEAPHAAYTRHWNNLNYTVRLSLLRALLCDPIEIVSII